MNTHGNEIETLILKMTFGAMTVGITMIFGLKMIGLVGLKWAAITAYLQSGKAITDLGGLLWNIIKEAVKGGMTG